MLKKRFKINLLLFSLVGFIFLGGLVFLGVNKINFHPSFEVGQKIDSLNGVYVYYNGGFSNIEGREITSDGYNLGLKYQCLHFVKKFYYQHLNHKMPNSYGHARDLYNPNVGDGQLNKDRDLIQFTNPSSTKPKLNDLLIFSPTIFNEFGHVAIISEVTENELEIIQQNVGTSSREKFSLIFKNDKWQINNSQILGWLGKR